MNRAGKATLMILCGLWAAPMAMAAPVASKKLPLQAHNHAVLLVQGLSMDDLNSITSEIGQPKKMASEPDPGNRATRPSQEAPDVTPFPLPGAGGAAPPTLPSASNTAPTGPSFPSGQDIPMPDIPMMDAPPEPVATGQQTIRPPRKAEPSVAMPPVEAVTRPQVAMPVENTQATPNPKNTAVTAAPKPTPPQTYDPTAGAMKNGFGLTPQQIESIGGNANTELQPVRITPAASQTGVNPAAKTVDAPAPAVPTPAVTANTEESPIKSPEPRQPVKIRRKQAGATENAGAEATGKGMVSLSDEKRARAARPAVEPVDSDDAKDAGHRGRKVASMNCSPPDLRLETLRRRGAPDTYQLRGVIAVPTEGYTYRVEPTAQPRRARAAKGDQALRARGPVKKRAGCGL